MNLYEINAQIMECIDTETGEVLDFERLEALNMAKAEKIDNVACWVKDLEADVAAFEKEEKAFAERKEAAKKMVNSLKGWLTEALDGQKWSSSRAEVRFRRSKAVDVLDEAAVPAQYMTVKTTSAPNKTAIAVALKSGEEVAGCQLIERTSATVK